MGAMGPKGTIVAKETRARGYSTSASAKIINSFKQQMCLGVLIVSNDNAKHR